MAKWEGRRRLEVINDELIKKEERRNFGQFK